MMNWMSKNILGEAICESLNSGKIMVIEVIDGREIVNLREAAK